MTSIFEGYQDHFNKDVRLIILRALAQETDGRLNSAMITRVLESFAVNRTRDYVHTQLNWLESEAQAVILTRTGTVVVAELTQQGEDHLSRKVVIEGVNTPSRRKA